MEDIIKKENKIYRKIALVVCVFVSGFIICVCSACSNCAPNYPESGYFKYHNYGEGVVITGLSELGADQPVIVIPKEIEGTPVKYLGQNYVNFCSIESKKLEYFYLLFDVYDLYLEDLFKNCPNLKAIFCLSDGRTSKINVGNGDGTSHEVIVYDASTANVVYKYNFKDGKGRSTYWIDNYEYGDSLQPIPEPTREGYKFDGWYKDEACETPWDFANDTLPQAIYDDNGNELLQQTILYAKWIEK